MAVTSLMAPNSGGLMGGGSQLLTRLDDDTLMLVARKLEMVESQVQQQRYPELKGKQHFAIDNEGGPTILSRTYQIMGRRGAAQWGLNFPRVDMVGQERTVTPKEFSVGYGYNFLELDRAIAGGINLEGQKAINAAQAVAEFENRVIYFGDVDRGIPGAFTHPNFPIVRLRTPINRNATSSVIVDAFNDFIQLPAKLSRNVERFTTVLMPNEYLQWLRGTPYSDAAPQITIMQRIQESNPGIEFDWCNECLGAGTNGTDIMFGYNRNPVNMKVWIPHPMDVKQTVMTDNYEFKTGVWELIGGLLVYFAVGAIAEIPA